MKKRIVSIIFALLFLTFLGVIDRPFILQRYNDRIETQTAIDYKAVSADLNDTKKEQMRSAGQRYNEELRTGLERELITPFQDQGGLGTEYQNLLDIEQNGMMGVVRIPKIKVALPIYHGTRDAVLQKGAGHIEGSSFPLGGDNTHTCIAAHSGLTSKVLFTDLDLIEMGDIFYLDVLDETLTYQVYAIETVLPDQVDSLKIQNGKDLATLITCTPYGINSHRLYIHGHRIFDEAEVDTSTDIISKGFLREHGWIVLNIALVGLMVYMLYWFNKSPEKNGGNDENK